VLTKIVDVTVEVLDAAVLNPVIPVNDRCPDVLVNKVVPAYRDTESDFKLFTGPLK
jgi:hypothetical protein